MNNRIIYSDIHYFTEPENLKLRKPEISIKTKKINNGFIINLNSEYLAKNVYLSVDEKGYFTDNFFDIIPGETKNITFITNKKIKDFDKKIKMKSIYQTSVKY